MKEIEFERLSEVSGGTYDDPSGAAPLYGPYPYQRDEFNKVPQSVAPDPQP